MAHAVDDLLMEEVLHHLGLQDPVTNGINYYLLINWCKISSINSSTD